MSERVLQGLPASPGRAVGPAFCPWPAAATHDPRVLTLIGAALLAQAGEAVGERVGGPDGVLALRVQA
jgi:hypothetical protein